MPTNMDIRYAAVRDGVKLWEVADKLGLRDASLSRKLRKELSVDEKNRIFNIIAEIRAGRQ